VELLVSRVWLRPFDDETVTEELEVVELPVAALLELLVDEMVELEFRTPLETTLMPTTISIATTTMATILEEIALAAFAIIVHPVREVAGGYF
jgi:hypothetical protein